MRRKLSAALVLCVLLAGCSSPSAAPDTPSPVPPTARPTPSGPTPNLPIARAVASPSASPVGAQPTLALPTFALQSSAFSDGGSLPSNYTCDGAGQSPPLSLTGAPPGTAAFALIEQDTDATGQPFTEWLLYNMPKTVMQLPEAVAPKPLLTNGVQQGTNDQKTIGYAGACPDPGQSHHIQFLLYAQDGYVTLETGAGFPAVQDALNGHTLAHTQLTVLVQR
jgi:Raf kinase inhibitor-like YbhB/YbcL family protein